MSSRVPSPASDLTVLQRRRLSWSVAKGAGVLKAAKRAGLKAPAARELAADPSISALVEAYRSMVAMPEEERHRRLVEISLRVLEEAVICGDRRAMLFILAHHTRGRVPAEVLSKGVVKALERQAARPRPDPSPPVPTPSEPSTPIPSASPPPPREPACPIDNAISGAGHKLRAEVLDEVEIEAAAMAARPVRNSNRPLVSLQNLSPRQAVFLANMTSPRSAPTGTPPETDPHNPNAPNTN